MAGEKISIPPTASISIEHERGSSKEELEFQVRWPTERKTLIAEMAGSMLTRSFKIWKGGSTR
jgi:hypothetical protein